jgi:hypothetical protein
MFLVFVVSIRAGVPKFLLPPLFSIGTKRRLECCALQWGTGDGMSDSRAEQYRQYAAECLRVAQQLHDAQQRATLLEMAQRWRDLAQKAEHEDNDR